MTYLDEVRRALGDAAVPREWRRIWRGYASLAYFVEHALLQRIEAGDTGTGDAGQEPVDLIL